MLMLRTAVCALFTAVAAGVFAADIIIESRAEGQNHGGYSEPVGRWLDSNIPPATAKSGAAGLTPQGTAGSRKTTVTPGSNAGADEVVSAARFTPTIESAGDYNVYVTFPKAGNATPVTIFIKHANGEETKDILQDGWGALGSANGDAWITVGKFPFAPGAEQYVELRVTGKTGAADPRNPIQAFADAVRFNTEPLPEASAAAPAVAGKTPAPLATPATVIRTADSNRAVAANANTAAAPSNAPIKWATDLAAARAAAGKADKKVIVFFYSPQSSRSTDYEKQVLNDPKVKAVIVADFVPLKINMETEKQLTTQLQVFRAGTINVYDAATGNGLERIGDAPEVDDLIRRLNAVK